MPDFTLPYVYQCSDFHSDNGCFAPPDALAGYAKGQSPYALKLTRHAQPQQMHLADDTTTRDHYGNPIQILTAPITLDGVRHPSGSRVTLNYRIVDPDGFEGFSVSIGQSDTQSGKTTGFLTYNVMQIETEILFHHDVALQKDSDAYREFACFTHGAKIKTACGERRIEDIKVGDRVMTLDHGLQRVRWAGSRTVPAMGQMTPIKIDAGTLGCSEDLHVSPNHRMLISGAMAELLCGQEEMLISAIERVNDRTVSQVEGGFVTYVHIMFDYDEVIWANDSPSESFFAGDDALNSLNQEQAAEVLSLFPDIADNPNWQTMARSECQPYEASVISATL